MSSSRWHSNGRSPLVNPQRQITAFFSKSSKSQSSSPPSLLKPSPNPKISHSTSKLNLTTVANPNPSHSPTTPSPPNGRSKSKSIATKPLLVIGEKPSAATVESDKGSYGDEVVNKRIRVYWPLDKSWYEGCVKSFNKVLAKHLVQYDDQEEELLDLSKEKIEWLEGSVKKFRRLRRVLVVNEDIEEDKGVEEDDSADEDWCKNAAAEEAEDCLEDMDLEDEEEDACSLKKKGANSGTKKRKAVGQEKVGLAKKQKEGGDTGNLAATANKSMGFQINNF